MKQQNKLITTCQLNCYNFTKYSNCNSIYRKKLKNNPGIYIVYSEKHKTCYIGQSKNVVRRLREHKCDMLKTNIKNANFREHYKQCNFKDFKFKILCQGPEFENPLFRKKEEIKYMKQKEGEGFQLYNQHRFSSYKGTNNPNAGKASKNAINIEIKGIKYKSIKEASLRLNIPFRQLYYRLKSANFPEYKGIEKINKSRNKPKAPVKIKGITYESISEASRLLSIPHSTIYYRLKNPKFLDYTRITESDQFRNKQVLVEINGIQYKSITDASLKLKIRFSTLYYRLKSSKFLHYKRII